jgi:acyl-CoA synthetase (AMP-forming)/AMP-acid ligase II
VLLIRVKRAAKPAARGAALTLDELLDRGCARIARDKLPTILHVVAALPRNASGKVMKTEPRGRFAERPVPVASAVQHETYLLSDSSCPG